jgi:hypothetical protein
VTSIAGSCDDGVEVMAVPESLTIVPSAVLRLSVVGERKEIEHELAQSFIDRKVGSGFRDTVCMHAANGDHPAFTPE